MARTGRTNTTDRRARNPPSAFPPRVSILLLNKGDRIAVQTCKSKRAGSAHESMKLLQKLALSVAAIAALSLATPVAQARTGHGGHSYGGHGSYGHGGYAHGWGRGGYYGHRGYYGGGGYYGYYGPAYYGYYGPGYAYDYGYPYYYGPTFAFGGGGWGRGGWGHGGGFRGGHGGFGGGGHGGHR